MNVKMKELLDWAKDHARIYLIECELANIPVVQEEYDRRFQEMFAELIVRECAEIANDKMKDIVDSIICEEQIDSEIFVGNKIKQPFGVE